MPARSNAKDLQPEAPPFPAGGEAGRARMSSHSVGVLLALAAAGLWSTSGLFVKVLAIDPLPLTALRCAMAGVILAPLLRSFKFRVGWEMAVLAVWYLLVSLTWVTATKWTTAANAIALQSTSPAWVFLVSCLLARRILWRFSAPIGIILAGLAVILLEPVGGTSFRGNLLGLVSGIAFAGTAIFYARVNRPVIEVMVQINLAAALALFLMAPGAFRFAEYTGAEWLSLAYLGGVQVGLGHICFYSALKRIGPSRAAILALLEPLLNPIWVYLAIGEVPSLHGFVGGGLVLSGIGVDAWLRRRRGGERAS